MRKQRPINSEAGKRPGSGIPADPILALYGRPFHKFMIPWRSATIPPASNAKVVVLLLQKNGISPDWYPMSKTSKFNRDMDRSELCNAALHTGKYEIHLGQLVSLHAQCPDGRQ